MAVCCARIRMSFGTGTEGLRTDTTSGNGIAICS
jgi:hypothetical protein